MSYCNMIFSLYQIFTFHFLTVYIFLCNLITLLFWLECYFFVGSVINIYSKLHLISLLLVSLFVWLTLINNFSCCDIQFHLNFTVCSINCKPKCLILALKGPLAKYKPACAQNGDISLNLKWEEKYWKLNSWFSKLRFRFVLKIAHFWGWFYGYLQNYFNIIVIVI